MLAQIDPPKQEQKTSSYILPKALEPFRESNWLASDPNKKPVSAVTGTSRNFSDPRGWAAFDWVLSYIAPLPGYVPAYFISLGGGLVAIDLDDVVVNDKIIPSAQAIIDRFKGVAYIERSSSGRGFHIFAKGNGKPGKKIKASLPGGGKVEIYDDNKPIRVTCDQYCSCEYLQDATQLIAETYNEIFPEDTPIKKANWTPSPPLSDEDVLVLLRKAKNADKFIKLFDKGSLSDYNNDASSADLALVQMMAFYTQDPAQLDRMFRKSRLVRPKWDREDYRTGTIQKALDGLTATWSTTSTGINKGASWENPTKIDPQSEDLEIDFPKEALPPILREALEEISRAFCVDPALISLPALGISALMIGKKAIVVEKPGLTHRCSMFFVGVAASGERKSSCFDAILDPIKNEIDKELEEYNKEKAAVRTHNELIKEEVAEIKKRLKESKIGPQDAKATIEKLYASEKPFPPEPHNFGDDITEPRLFQKLHEHGGAYGVFSSDARSIFKKILGKKDGESGEAIYLNGMWGDDISRSRVGNNKGLTGGEDMLIRKPALTTVGFVQPDLWAELAKDRRMRESGFLARISLVIPSSQMGTRFETETDVPLNYEKVRPFVDTTLRIRKWKPPTTVEVPLSTKAADLRRQFYNSIEGELVAGGKFEDVKDIATKATSIACRLALNIALMDAASDPKFNGCIPPISEEQWLQAQALEEYFLAQAVDSQRIHSKKGSGHLLDKVVLWLKKKVLEHVKVKPDEPFILLASQISKAVRGASTDDVEKLLPTFIEHRWLKSVTETRNGKTKFEVNPRIAHADT